MLFLLAALTSLTANANVAGLGTKSEKILHYLSQPPFLRRVVQDCSVQPILSDVLIEEFAPLPSKCTLSTLTSGETNSTKTTAVMLILHYFERSTVM